MPNPSFSDLIGTGLRRIFKRSSLDSSPSDPNWIEGSTYGTGLDYQSSDNPMYDAYYKANPFVGQTYNKTFIDKAFGGLFRTSYDQWLDEMRLNAAQYDAGVTDIQMQNYYNSEAQKADRMRDAGLNPDLLGTGDVSDSARPSDDPQDAQIPGSQVESALSSIYNFAMGFNNIVSGAISMYKTFQDINFDKIRADKEVSGLAEEDLFRTIPASGFETQEDYTNWHLSQSGLFDDPVFAETYRKAHNIPKAYFDRYKRGYSQSLDNLGTSVEFYRQGLERANLRKQYGIATGSKFYSESGFDELRLILDPLTKLYDKATELEAELKTLVGENAITEQGIVSEELQNKDLALDVQRADIANQGVQASIQSDYLRTLKGEGYGVESAQLDAFNVRMGKLIAECQQEIIEGLRNASDEGSRLAKCLEYQMVLSKFYNFNPANILQGMASGVTDQVNSTKQTAAMLSKLFF